MTESAGDLADLTPLSYRLDSYEILLQSLQTAGYEFRSFDLDTPPDGKEILLRHDIDLSLGRALAMAEREQTLGVQSTYCVLCCSPVYTLTRPQNVRTLQRISELGHDIALHFDTHTYWAADDEPSPDSVVAKVTDELEIVSRLIGEDVSTVSFHIPPDWVLDRSFEAFINTYAPPFFSEIAYVSDSDQKWHTNEPFPDGIAERFQLLVHPGLWHTDHQPMADIVETHRDHAHQLVDSYFDPLG